MPAYITMMMIAGCYRNLNANTGTPTYTHRHYTNITIQDLECFNVHFFIDVHTLINKRLFITGKCCASACASAGACPIAFYSFGLYFYVPYFASDFELNIIWQSRKTKKTQENERTYKKKIKTENCSAVLIKLLILFEYDGKF